MKVVGYIAAGAVALLLIIWGISYLMFVSAASKMAIEEDKIADKKKEDILNQFQQGTSRTANIHPAYAPPQNLQINGENCVYYGPAGPGGTPVYNCNGTLKDKTGKNYGNA